MSPLSYGIPLERDLRTKAVKKTPNQPLCGRCSKLPLTVDDWERFMPEATHGTDFFPWQFLLSDLDGLSPKACEFCWVLQEALTQRGLITQSGEYLDIIAYYKCLGQQPAKEDPVLWLKVMYCNASNVLSVVPHRNDNDSLYKNSSTVPSMDTGKIDWELVRGWLHHCDAMHAESCSSHETSHTPSADLQVIDCETREIVHLPQHSKYAALSYVWGVSHAAPEPFRKRLHTTEPRTIEDAIICTHTIGLRYLWIDRYCIDQADTTSKHILIMHMDKVYRNAAVTLINAAGEGPDCGLPGVSSIPRRRQSVVTIQNVTYSTVPSVRLEMLESAWATRGCKVNLTTPSNILLTTHNTGTYQEGLLSRRRLVFNQSHVAFQCMESYAFDTFISIFPILQSNLSFQYPDPNFEDTMQGFPALFAEEDTSYGSDRAKLRRIDRRITEFLNRTLSYEADMLNAFMGVLHQAWILPNPSYHFWGLPFDPYTEGAMPTEDSLLASLFWLHKDEMRQISRRELFPSWTWAGWHGLKAFRGSESVRYLAGGVSFEDIHDQRLSLPEYISQMRTSWRMNDFKPLLYVTGWFTQMFVHFEPESWDPHRFRASRGASIKLPRIKVHLVCPEGVDPRTLAGVWPTIVFQDGHDRRKAHGLVLKDCGNGAFEISGISEHEFSLTPSDQAQASIHAPEEVIQFGVLNRQREDELKVEWRTIKLV